MAATIQTIQTPKRARALDTSGNNNHGQIYSGRGLEFDGVTDYLTTGSAITLVDYSAETTQANKAWTVACWLHQYSLPSATTMSVVSSGSSISSGYIGLRQTSNKLTIYDVDNSAWRLGNTSLDLNTWYRAVWVFDGDETVSFYLNGVSDGSGTISTDGVMADLTTRYVGALNSTSRFWDGMLSDLQYWQGAWTQSDVTYDYLNPEQLALNNGGTSLTESNLKVWYPMQDGHKGQQSYILDGANTGLGDAFDFDNDGTWSQVTNDSGGSSVNGNTITFVNNAANSTDNRFDFSRKLLSGVTYKITCTVSGYSAGDAAAKLYLPYDGHISGTAYNIVQANGTYEYYYTSQGYNNFIVLTYNAGNNGVNATVVIDEIKPVNAKNHATTVFYGKMSDLLVGAQKTAMADALDATDDTFDFATGTTNLVTGDGTGFTATNASFVNASGLGLLTNTASSQGKVTFDIATVTGRAYQVKVSTGAQNSNVAVSLGTNTTYNSDNTTGNIAASQTDVRLGTAYTALDHTTKLVIQLASSTNTEYANIDNLVVQEVGQATGWAEADQQLDIPQIALQSYNELAWFDGATDNVLINPSTDIWNDSVGEWNSVSCWAICSAVNLNRMIWGVQGSEPNLYITSSGSDYKVGYNTGNGEVFGITIAKSLIDDKWIHWVMNFKVNNNSADTAIDATDVELFFNGQKLSIDYETTEETSNQVSPDANSDLTLMNAASTGSYPAGGSITEISVWKDQLSVAEAEELYNGGKALDALTHSNGNLSGYWRNDGSANWKDLTVPAGTGNNGSNTSGYDSTLLLPAGVDGSRDIQGFIMNRQRTTSSLNFPDNMSIFDSYVESGAMTITSGTDFTIAFWAKPIGTYTQVVLGASGNDYISFSVSTNDVQISLRAAASSYKTETFASSVLHATNDLNKWQYWTITRGELASNQLRFFLNGEINPTGANITTHACALDFDLRYIGAESTTGTSFEGVLDDVVIYNSTALTPAQVKRNYNAGKRSHRNG